MAAITDLTTMSAATDIASGDYLVVHDVSVSTDKKITRTNFFGTSQAFNGVLLSAGTASIADAASSGLTTILVGAPASMNGILFVINASQGTAAQFYLRGGGNAAVEMSDASGTFSATAGTASSTNIYYSGGYGIQNNTGATRTYLLYYIGTA